MDKTKKINFFQLLAGISVFIPRFINSPYCLTFICGDLLSNFPLYRRKRQQFERAEVTEKTPLLIRLRITPF
jgi:hypothetical protein